MDESHEVLYRCELQFGETGYLIRFDRYRVIRTTPKGHWISKYQKYNRNKNERWVPAGYSNRFAFVTKEEALNSYTHRKRRHIKILKQNLSLANKTLQKAKDMLAANNYDDSMVEELILW